MGLSRRFFAAVPLLFALSAQAEEAIKRAVLEKAEFPGATYATILVHVDVAANSVAQRHTHPGLEIGTCTAGEFDLLIDGQAPLHIKSGDHYQIAAGVPHSLKTGAAPMTVLATYVVDKDKPLATPVP
jgi:quercetin dioxygenase-like cupin family protein